ncbi:hypothetical protein CEQ90_14260 [Lewinellaceae bacterium SD302]|nr:hypothetical protein CEQ90_14260 [Lewinellaceae bacterium SD302]
MLRILLLLLLSSLTACAPKQLPPAPVDVDRLAAAISDLHLAGGLAGELAVTIRDSMQKEMEDRVLERHGYASEEFDSLMWLIRSEPEWVEEVFQKVSDGLATFEAESSRIPVKVEPEND